MDETVPTIGDDALEAAETFVGDWVSEDRIPGATMSVFDPHGTTASAFGARKLRENEPATPDTLLGIGSCTKSFTGVAILQLAEEGKLAVDDPVNDYVDAYQDAPGEPVTIRDLLSHSSGLPSDGMATALISRMMGLEPVEVPLSGAEDFRRHVADALDERVTHHDEPFFYYNSGFTVLGEIIEELSGQSYAEYVEERILDPLGMERSTFSEDAFEADEDRMTPYYKEDGSATPGSFPFDESIHAPGGMLSSVRELARYGRMHLNGGELAGERVLPAKRIEEARTPVSQREQLVDGTPQEYAYGWMVREFLDDTLVCHGGGIGVYNAFVGYLRDAELGVAVQCTTTPETHPMYAGPAVLALLLGEEPEAAVPHLALKRALPELTGEYASYRGIMEFTVERMGGGLALRAETDRAGALELPLVPADLGDDDWVFTTVEASGAEVPIRFERTEDGVDLYYQRWRLHKQD
ncbi:MULTISPECIES: serine hydrolase [Halolamina]|uniref:CubicO group peptidase, beta-lactamase class C family n=1 Tax=Halolamina pelagica TaxID=699431 RepID=A0A1I5W9U9_9EURY|nr:MULTISPECIES: serine hydrolase [Halolamina]NHX37498.1 serine hydrolase [Halolamina sp. R1-12]SFQ16528.1 CubicO group peptidase, beta-lactamase class C family [Halolamina pelagica]